MDFDHLAEKHAYDHFEYGFRLVDYYEAAFPVYVMNLKTLIQTKREIPILWEFILKLIEAGQKSVKDIANLLGLEYQVVENGLDELQRQKFVQFIGLSKPNNQIRIELTNKGILALKDLFFKEPEISTLKVLMDGLTGELSLERPLRISKDVRKYDYFEISPYLPLPDLNSIKFANLKRLVNKKFADNDELFPGNEKKELVDLLEIEKSWTDYQILRILQFIRPEDGSLLLQIYDMADRMREHEAVIQEMEEKKLRPLRAQTEEEILSYGKNELENFFNEGQIDAARKLAIIEPELQSKLKNKKDDLDALHLQQDSQIPEKRNEINYLIQKQNKEIENLNKELNSLRATAGEVEGLQMFQHRPILLKALKEAKRQVIIVSPWLNLQAIDYEFQNNLKIALERNIEIYIIYGFGNKEYEEEKAKKQLVAIKKEAKKGQLFLHRLREIHSKVLICDKDFMVTTSFNWLSFAGDPKRGCRFEDGILTRNKNAITSKTKEWMDRIRDKQ